MQRRTVFSLVNVAVAAGTLVVLFAFPRYAGYAVYAFLGWFVVSVSVLWVARPAGTVPAPGGAAPAAGAGASAPQPRAPLPSAPATSSIGFCVYCASDLPVGAGRCPACGHAVLRLA